MARRMAHMTTAEVQEALRSGIDTVILPIGATEQHGPQLPNGTDYFAAEVIAHRTAEKLEALVAPTLPFGMSEHHMRFPGTITLDSPTLALVVRDVIVSLARTGFTFVVIINGHLANVAPMLVGAREAKTRTGVRVAFTSYWDAIQDAYRGWLDASQQQWTFRQFNAHGGKMEGSLSMVFDPESVHPERAEWDDIARTMLAAEPTLSYMSEIEDIAPTGTFGDPAGATAELGSAIAEEAAEKIARQARLLYEAFVVTGGRR